MKKLFVGLLIVLLSSTFLGLAPANKNVADSEFCKGFKDGYCEGYKDVKGTYANCPVTPVCPVPEVGKDHYKGGYNTGFKSGMKKAYSE